MRVDRGLSIIELFVILVIIAILATIAIPAFQRYYRGYKYKEYVLQVESTLKWARMTAMERGINVSVCGVGNGVNVYNSGTSMNITCSGTLLRRVNVTGGDASFMQINVEGNFGFDPRGLAIESSTVYVRRTDHQSCTRYRIVRLGPSILREDCQ